MCQSLWTFITIPMVFAVGPPLLLETRLLLEEIGNQMEFRFSSIIDNAQTLHTFALVVGLSLDEMHGYTSCHSVCIQIEYMHTPD